MKAEGRWQWVKRPRWAVTLAVLGLILAWCLWPVRLYEVVGRTGGFCLTIPGESGFTGGYVQVGIHNAGPWKVAKELEKRGGTYARVRVVPGLGEEAFWGETDDPSKSGFPRLHWRRGNLQFSLWARKKAGIELGTPEWFKLGESFARDTDAAVLEGEVENYEIRPHWIPRGWVWARMEWDAWQDMRGKRTLAWW